MNKRVIIMRGIPGSGKSTEAQRWLDMVPQGIAVSADTFMYAGDRAWDSDRLEWCHERCQETYVQMLDEGVPLIIVDNTNTKGSDLVFYVQWAERRGYAFSIFQINVDPKVAFERGRHPVPLATLELMGRRLWSERLPTTWDVWQKGAPWRPPQDRSHRQNLTNPKGHIEVSRRVSRPR